MMVMMRGMGCAAPRGHAAARMAASCMHACWGVLLQSTGAIVVPASTPGADAADSQVTCAFSELLSAASSGRISIQLQLEPDGPYE